MATIATMQPQGDNVVTVDANGRGEKTFTVTNIYGAPMRMGFRCLPEKPEQCKDWAKPRSKAEQDLGVNMSNQITVGIEVPKETRPGRYTFRLLAYSTRDANLNFSESEPFMVDVPAQEEPEPEPRRFPWGIVIAASVAGVLLIGGLLTWLLWPKTVTVPQLVGLPLDEAVTALEKAGLKTGSVTEEITGKVLGGIVRLQNPDADSELEGGKLVPVDLVVEAFSVEVPGLKNKTVVQAEEELVGAGLTLGEVTEKRTGNAPGGTVLDSKPSPGERAPPGTAVAVTVETKSMLVPSVTGQTLSEASNTLETLGLRVGKIDQRQTGAQGGVVLSQVPVPGSQAPPGTAIALVVERQTVAVPNVTRKTLTQAMRELGAINLRVAVIKTRTGRNRPGVVFQQSPAVNAKVAPGSTVNLNVEDQPPPPPRVQSQGQIAIAQTWTADLDTGKTGNSADADIWFQAQTALVRFVTPRNGAQIAKGGKSPVGVTGCQQAKLSTASILINSLPAGTYVCARTNKGQYSEFRVVSTVGRTLKISYTTWGMPSGNQIVNFPTTIHIVPALQQLKLLQRSLAPAE